MVVEDDEPIRDTLREIIEMEGYRVVTAANGRDALTYLRAGELPSLMLLDLMMPVMNGWELYGLMQEEATLAAIPVVILTAAGPRATQSIEMPRVEHKPLRIERLIEMLHDCAN